MNIKTLKKLMIENDLKVNDLAKILGIKRQVVYSRLSGLRPFKIEEIKILSDYFKIDINVLIN